MLQHQKDDDPIQLFASNLVGTVWEKKRNTMNKILAIKCIVSA